MAEKITIEFGGERIEIPEFAMDSTLKTLIQVTKSQRTADAKDAKDVKKAIENLMKELVGVNAKQRAKQEVDAQKETTEAVAKATMAVNKSAKTPIGPINKVTAAVKRVREAIVANSKTTKAAKDTTGAVNKVKDAVDKSSKAQKGLLSKLGGGQGSILGGVVSKFGKFGKMLNPVTAGLFGLFNAIKSVTAFLMKMGRLENTLFRRGFNFVDPEGRLADGIAALGAQATDASLSIDEFVELTSQFATAFGEFGTQTITDAIQNTQDLLKSQGFLGLSNSEMSQAVAEMAEQFRALGLNVEGQSQFLANQTVKVLQTTQAFTKLTNTSNDVIRQMVMQASSMEAFRNAMQMLPTDMRTAGIESSQVAFAGLAALGEDLGGQLTTALSEGIGRGGLQFTDFGQQLAGVSPILLNSLQELSYAAGNGGDVVGALDNFRNAIGDVDANQRQFLRALEISGDPMAKFVIKLANMNETIDDTSFRKLQETMGEIDAGQLGVAQTQLALAMARIRTAFQKLQIAFLTPEVVDGFEVVVKKVVSIMETVAKFLKDNLYNIINSFVTAIARGVRFLKNLFTGNNNVLAESSAKITKVATDAITATMNRAVAAAVPFGDTKSELDKMDKLKDAVNRSATQEEYDENLKKLYDYVFNTSTTFGIETDALFKRNAETNLKKEQEINDRLGKYGVNLKGFNVPVKDEFDKSLENPIEDINLNGTQPRNQRIKIMPMYGDLDDYANAEDSPQIKILKKQLEVANAQLEELRSQSSKDDEKVNTARATRDALRAMQSDNAYSTT